MSKVDLQAVIRQVEPETKAAQLRAYMPAIERKLATGVSSVQLHEEMSRAGFVVAFETLKTYLYQHRKKHGTSRDQGPAPGDTTSVAAASALAATATFTAISRGAPPDAGSPSVDPNEDLALPPLAPWDVDSLLRRDPTREEEDAARYTQVAQRDSRRARRTESP